MSEKKRVYNNFDAASGTTFRISKFFQRRKQKLYTCILFEKEYCKFINHFGKTESTDLILEVFKKSNHLVTHYR